MLAVRWQLARWGRRGRNRQETGRGKQGVRRQERSFRTQSDSQRRGRGGIVHLNISHTEAEAFDQIR